MAGFSSFLKQKAAAALSPTASPAVPASQPGTAPVAAPATSKFSMPSMPSVPSFNLPGLTLPSIGLGIIPMGIDSCNNQNLPPTEHLYPSVLNSGNPDYTVAEPDLRAAMQFPKTWTNGMNKQPVILVPGTGGYGGSCFHNNFAQLLTASNFADPMWLNIPGAMCDESPKNAEYVAYAIHYVWLLCRKPVTLIAWSQGNLACQFALKYFPWTRNKQIPLVNNLISISADFHGTLTAYGILPNSPAIINQQYYSTFIRTLRSNGGDSAYVPTTSIYSSLLDEVVQPQAGINASAYMDNKNGVDSTNVDLQATVPFRPAGLLYGHAGVLYNSLAWALAKDAIINGGPGQLSRIDMDTVAMQPFAPGLDLNDVNMTLGLIPVCGVNIVKFFPKYITESKMPVYCLDEANKLPPAPALNAQQKMVVQQSKLAGGTLPTPASQDQAEAQAAAVAQGQAPAAPQGQIPVVTDPSVIAAAQSAEAQAAVAASAAGSAVSAVAAGAVPQEGQAPAPAPVQA